jgi:hypothetical protein
MMSDFNHRAVVLMTFHAKLYRGVWQHHRLGCCVQSNYEVTSSDRQYVDLIEASLSCLEEEYRRIVTNDFLNPQPRHWWMEYYAKSTYYRLRQRALEHFLRCLHG